MTCCYTNITVEIGKASYESLLGYLDYAKAPAFVSPVIGRYALVYDEYGEDSLAEDISRKLRCKTFFVANHHDAVLWYQLFENGTSLDTYNSWPGYYESPIGRAKPEGGDAQVLCDAFGFPGMTVRVDEILHNAYALEVRRHQELSQLLCIPMFSVGVGYNDIETGELPPTMLNVSVLRQTPRDNTAFQVVLRDESEHPGSPQCPSVLTGPADLGNMTMRALVAIAARSARRAQLGVTIPPELTPQRRYSDAVDKALSLAEEFAAGGAGDQHFRYRIAKVGDKCRQISNDLQIIPQASPDVVALADAAASASYAASAALSFAIALLIEGTRDFAPNVEAAVQSAYKAMQKGIVPKSEFLRLKTIGSGKNTELGQPIDPSESGPLGAL